MAAIRRRRPRRRSDEDTTFTIGSRPDYLAISTDGPRQFIGQHPIWAASGKFEGAMMFRALILRDVIEIIGAVYAGRNAESALARYQGVFQFYTPDPDALKDQSMQRCHRCGVVRPAADFSLPSAELCRDCHAECDGTPPIRAVHD
jgi:hypothetical protein